MRATMKFPPSTRAVITGAGSGLGKALSLLLAERGARLLLSDLNKESAEATAREALRLGARVAEAVACDVTKLAEIEALASRTMELWGGLDLLVNNAGVGVAGEVGETSIDNWRHAIDVNLWGVIHGCHVFVPIFKRQRSGNVLNVASIAGLIHAPHMAPYNVTKAGVVALSETLRVELAAAHVGVTVLCPSFFETNILNDTRGASEGYLRFAKTLMSKASLSARDVAQAALDATEAGKLHALPMRDGRWMWRVKRLAPSLFIKAAIQTRQRVIDKNR